MFHLFALIASCTILLSGCWLPVPEEISNQWTTDRLVLSESETNVYCLQDHEVPTSYGSKTIQEVYTFDGIDIAKIEPENRYRQRTIISKGANILQIVGTMNKESFILYSLSTSAEFTNDTRIIVDDSSPLKRAERILEDCGVYMNRFEMAN